MANPKDISILIVDDDLELLESITSLFAVFGFSVEGATGGLEAWGKIQNVKFDIVITDVKMPDLGGLELLKKIRGIDPFRPKVLLISGFSDSSIEDILDMGANGFFSKPFNATAVRDALNLTLLSQSERWSQPVKRFGSFPIRKKVKSIDVAAEKHSFRFGQNGFFVEMGYDKPKVGEPVDFEIEFADNKPLRRFQGSGHVAWVRHDEKPNLPPGVGIKFDYLEDAALESFTKWLKVNRPVSTVPKN